jgi:hypothetical protein
MPPSGLTLVRVFHVSFSYFLIEMTEHRNRKIKSKSSHTTLREGEDYHVENGLFVFSEKYHLKRGYCCKSGCRHCPYGFRTKA